MARANSSPPGRFAMRPTISLCREFAEGQRPDEVQSYGRRRGVRYPTVPIVHRQETSSRLSASVHTRRQRSALPMRRCRATTPNECRGSPGAFSHLGGADHGRTAFRKKRHPPRIDAPGLENRVDQLSRKEARTIAKYLAGVVGQAQPVRRGDPSQLARRAGAQSIRETRCTVLALG
jgi:hypothetical protein